MRVILKPGILALSCETEDECESFAAWSAASTGHVFFLNKVSAKGAALFDLGPKPVACCDPINIAFRSDGSQFEPIDNLAYTPFKLKGRSYASVEGFWRGLEAGTEEDRLRIGQLWGSEAEKVEPSESPAATFIYDDQVYQHSSAAHRALMEEACRAKFLQNEKAREALLGTKDRPLTHCIQRDNKTIPGPLMADIWMRLRSKLRANVITGLQELPEGPSDGRILYFTRDRNAFGFMSHFHPAPIEMDGEKWATVEHFYQAQKSFDPAYRAAIRAAATPGIAKQLAARPKPDRARIHKSWFAEFMQEPRADWAEAKLDIMRRADLAKFTQHETLRKRLLETGGAELIEDSPHDAFWGTGSDGTGYNWAGKVLMEIRQRFRQP